ncbi:ABC transporter [Nocardiopsis sp. N85]|uniref:ABC transporter n=1 Tax=Nocardiopsis sp. N85 TaxID=3029400 RepID=UPI00237F0D1F|nr:ABC transporter [Nocardiopsis sp. N85]MDE3722521.1 ABC transporter [Nocardiopsis sp. N85]
MITAEHRTGTRAAVAAEWTKATGSARNRRTALAAVGLALVVAALFCLTMGPTTGVPLTEQPAFDVLTSALLGVDAAALVLTVLAAAVVGGEYATGMIRTTFTVTPRRGRVLVARAATVVAITGMVALVAAVGSALVSWVVLAVAGLPSWDVADPAVRRVVGGAALMAPFHALVATAGALWSRSTAGGVTVALALMAAPTLAGWIPGGGALLPFLPGEALHAVAGIAGPHGPHPVAAAAVLVVWSAAALFAADRAVRRRDV